ncbi:hypothetical protein YB2330_002517 [Saitoella coloradoensis]
MPRSKTPIYSLARGKVNMSMNRYNLYNLARKDLRNWVGQKTMYQQKWFAKAETRAYHGRYLTERQFKNHFEEKLLGTPGTNGGNNASPIPLASQTYAALEKRLDFAVFRALFASSIQQARQMVVHGKVKVNGEKINAPGHRLQPGDHFVVDPKAVLTALSADPSAVASEPDVPSAEAAFRIRPYFAPFAFIPTYLEVSQASCSAIYLRDPIASPGISEVPSPFPQPIQALAYRWYVRGR